jgi:16S rRNA (guanine1207-N2)-methyltransferase
MDHYFVNDDNLRSNRHQFEVTIVSHKFVFNTDVGVFSKCHIDFGTKLLLENIEYDKVNGTILDIGCGYGPIGIVLAKLTNCFIHMVDINLRALALVEINAKLNGVNNILIYESNMFDNVNHIFNMIITNPPIRAGKKIVYEMMVKAKDYLTDDGSLWFVIRKQQGAESLIKYLSDIYELAIVKKKKGYFVVKARKI